MPPTDNAGVDQRDLITPEIDPAAAAAAKAEAAARAEAEAAARLEAEAAAAAAIKNRRPKVITVRLLIDCDAGRINDTPELPAAAAKDLIAAGHADDHPDAVAYARSLR